MNEIVTTRKLATRHWVAEATDSRGEIISKSGKTKTEALTRLAEFLADREKARRYEVYRRELDTLRRLADKADFSEAGDSEFYEQRQKVAAAYRAACEDVGHE